MPTTGRPLRWGTAANRHRIELVWSEVVAPAPVGTAPGQVSPATVRSLVDPHADNVVEAVDVAFVGIGGIGVGGSRRAH